VIHSRLHAGARQGAIAPLTAILLIPLLGMVAFAVDLGWISLTQSDLQNAADSAALAAAGQLTDGFVQYNLPTQSTLQKNAILTASEAQARTYAKNFAGYNAAGGTALASVPDADVTFGFTDASGAYTPATANSGYPNTVKVTVRRDATANGSLGLFFGPVLGLSSVNLTASAAATIYAANVDSFQNTAKLHIPILPMTYDVANWNNFLATGKNPDGNPAVDANGNPAIQTYPSIKDQGNFGMFSLTDSTTGASTISDWIANGMVQSDFQQLQSASAGDQIPLLPLSQHNQNILPSQSTDGLGSWNWSGNPGLKTSDVHTLSNYVGDTYLFPLFKALDSNPATYTAGTGQGSNYYFNTVQFVSVRVVSTNNSTVVLQPSPMVLNPDTIILSSVVPAGTGSGSASTKNATTFTPPKLTQ
jgi:Flp pilus assembly protein TadG